MARNAERHSSVMTADVRALAGTYAEALGDHLGDDEQAGFIADELEALADVLADTPGAAGLFSLPLGVRDRCEMVERIFSGRVSRPVLALLSVMARRGRLALLGAVAAEFRRMLDARQGRIDVTVTTAGELTEAQRERLCSDIERTFNARPILTARVDPNILGVAVIRIGEMVYDASLASGLAKFDRQLTDRLAAVAAQGGTGILPVGPTP